jgi:hypothetical protein
VRLLQRCWTKAQQTWLGDVERVESHGLSTAVIYRPAIKHGHGKSPTAPTIEVLMRKSYINDGFFIVI